MYWRLALVIAAGSSLALNVGGIQGQTGGVSPPIKLDNLVSLMGSRTVGDKALSNMIRQQCVAFIANDRTVSDLKSLSRTPEVVQAVQEACYIGSSLEITTTDSSIARVSLDGVVVGSTPYRSAIEPNRDVLVEITRGNITSATHVTVPMGKLVEVSFSVRDTVALPKPPSRSDQEAIGRGVAIPGPSFTTKLPEPPHAPGPRNPVVPVLTGVVLAAGAAALAARPACAQNVAQYGPLQAGIRPYLGTKSVVQGGCYGLSIGVGSLAGALIADFWSRRSYRAGRARFQVDSATYAERASSAQRQQDLEREQWNRDNAAKLALLQRDMQAWKDAVALNQHIREANGAPPKIDTREPYPIRKPNASAK
jgi:hypothetical protein